MLDTTSRAFRLSCSRAAFVVTDACLGELPFQRSYSRSTSVPLSAASTITNVPQWTGKASGIAGVPLLYDGLHTTVKRPAAMVVTAGSPLMSLFSQSVPSLQACHIPKWCLALFSRPSFFRHHQLKLLHDIALSRHSEQNIIILDKKN